MLFMDFIFAQKGSHISLLDVKFNIEARFRSQ